MESNYEKLVRLKVAGLMPNQKQNGYYAMVLEEVNGDRRLQIVIGNTEAQSIECAMRRVRPPRPMTHDLMYQMMKIYHIVLYGVIIEVLPGGIFRGKMMLAHNDNDKHIMVDARSSDAVALAVRAGAPIYISPELLDCIGVTVSESDSDMLLTDVGESHTLSPDDMITLTGDDIESMSRHRLEELLRQVIEEEKYEEAARIKAELDRRFPGTDTSQASEP